VTFSAASAAWRNSPRPPAPTTIPVSSAEDTLLAKLEWFRRGGEVSERQWTDVKGLLAAARSLDADYLDRGARELGVADLLRRARDETTGHTSANPIGS
jgi:hypothetical protein